MKLILFFTFFSLKLIEQTVFAFEIDDIRLDLSYGQISGKWWGSKEKRPILLLHGWQDNSGSFDTLIPLLSSDYSYFAIDLPGHGFSSHIPKGCYYHPIDFVPLLEEIRIKLKWNRLSLIGHSMGSIVSFFYAAISPENVDFVVALDTLKPQNYNKSITEKLYTYRMKNLIKLIENFKEQSPEYTYDELIQRVYEGSMHSVNLDKAKYMIDRGKKISKNGPNKFSFTRDIRIKFMQPFPLEHEIALEYIKQIKSAYLFINGDDRNSSESQKNIREAIDQFKVCNKNFEYLKVPGGTHHFHLNQPELIAKKITTFLEKHYIQEAQQSFDSNCKL